MHQEGGAARRGASGGLPLPPHAWARAARERAARDKSMAHVRTRSQFSGPSTCRGGGGRVAQLHKRDSGTDALLGPLSQFCQRKICQSRAPLLFLGMLAILTLFSKRVDAKRKSFEFFFKFPSPPLVRPHCVQENEAHPARLLVPTRPSPEGRRSAPSYQRRAHASRLSDESATTRDLPPHSCIHRRLLDGIWCLFAIATSVF